MRAALACALDAEARGNLPIGCVIVLDNAILTRGSNGIFRPDYAPLRHAEMVALAAIAGTALRTRSRDMTLYSTLEPCLMCFGAATVARIGRVVFGAADPDGGVRTLAQLEAGGYTAEPLPQLEAGIMQIECDALFERARVAFRSYPRAQLG